MRAPLCSAKTSPLAPIPVPLTPELLDAKLIDLSATGTTLFTKLAAIVSQRKTSDEQEETCLLVCASPTDLLGIYKIDKDTLTLCMADPDLPRPREFKAEKGSKHTLMVFKRLAAAPGR